MSVSNLPSATRAFCYLGAQKDDKNLIAITSDELIIHYRGSAYHFDLQDIKKIEFNHRKIMLPLISGGVIAPLSAIGIFYNIMSPWILLAVFFSSLFTFYWGWIGTSTLSILHKDKDYDFFLHKISQNLRAFCELVNQILQSSDEAVYFIYHIANRKIWKLHQDQEYYHPLNYENEGFIHASTKNQLSKSYLKHFLPDQDLIILEIDPFLLDAEVRYELDTERGQLFPHIYGKINTAAINKAFPLKFDHNGDIIIAET